MAHRIFYVGIGLLIPIAAFIAYYDSIGGLPDLAFLLRYQSYYLRKHELYLPEVLGQIAVVVISQAPFLLLAGWQAVRMARQPVLTRRDVFLLLFLGFSVLPFFLGGHYFPHYMVQAIPAVVLLATEALAETTRATSGRLHAFFFRHARTFIVVNVALFSVVNTAYYGLVLSDGPNPALARFIQQHTHPDDSVFLWTWRSHVLFEVNRAYATRFLSNEFLTGRLYGTPHRLPTATVESASVATIPELWPVLLEDLRAEKPRVIIDDAPGGSNFTLDHYPALSAFVREYYEPGQLMDGLCVYLRKTG
jgi:4-amino-4-deoxy-L-arabinose transferase-like glycosyltransferase